MRSLVLEVFYDGARRAQHLGAVPRLLRHAPRPAGGVPVGGHRGPGGPGLQQLAADAVPGARARRSSTNAGTGAAVLYYQVDYTLQPVADGRRPASTRRLPPGEPDHDGAGLRHRRRASGAGPLRRVQRRRAGHRPGRLVRRGRGQGLP